MPFPSTSSATSNHRIRVVQNTADAGLHAGDLGNIRSVSLSMAEPLSAQELAYVQGMQRAGLTQTFGCMIAVEVGFRVIAYSANAPEFLDLMPSAGSSVWEMPNLGIGTDLRTLFTPSSAASLEKAAATEDVGLLNPITVHCRFSRKALYAIAHRIDVGMVIDFEAVEMSSVSVSVTGPLQSHNLAAKAITRLQALPGGDIALLCDTVVEEVQKLTGYDRVMAYKFHEDEHGEVVAEMRRVDLEPFFGLHYPATDIPRASRSLLMTNRVRMVGDCRAFPVRVIHDPNMKQLISLAGSTLRAPHGCHAQYMGNMGSIASLVMSVIINDDGKDDSRGAIQRGRKLWGLVVCHHTTPRAVPYSIRSACEFLMQAFGVQLNMEVELAPKLRERHILRTQTLLCDMLLQDAPIGIVCQSPNIMDLVNCDGAALYYGKRFWLLGSTPTENQIADIAEWLLECHEDSTGLSTDSLADAGYPGADLLGDAVCGMAAARITAKDFLFWFRSANAEDMKWGGAEHAPGGIVDGRRIHSRSSAKAIVKRSLPWEEVEMGAVHSLQLMLLGSFQDIDDSDKKTMIHARLNDLKLRDMDELSVVANDIGRLIETATAPILAVDSTGIINGWNAKLAEVTGLPVSEAKGRSLVKDLVLDESVVVVERLLHLASQGEEEENVEIKLKTFGAQKQKGAVILVVNSCSSRDVLDNVVGVCFVGQDVTGQKMLMDRFSRIQGDYETIVQNPHPLIPPIFGCDEYGYCFEWNPAMEGLTGWKRDEAVGKLIVGEIFGMQRMCCRMKSEDALTDFMKSLNNGIDRLNTDKVSFSFFDREGKFIETLLSTNKRTDANGVTTGVFCFLQSGDKSIVRNSNPLIPSSVDGDECGDTIKRNSGVGGLKDRATGSVGRLDVYLKRAEECMEVVEKMPSPRFNSERCQYLVDKLKAVVQSARLFLEVPHAQHHGPGPSRHGKAC